MTEQGWRQAVIKAASDPGMLNLLGELLHEQDMAKNILREKGYGCIGMPWRDMAREVPARDPDRT